MHGIRQNVRKFGFSVTGVLPDADHYPFTYTTGLGDALGYELAVLGIDNSKAHHLIHAVEEYLKDGGDMPPGERVLVHGLPLRLEPVDLDNTWLDFSVTARYYEDRAGWELRVMQVLMPDDQYVLPGEEGADPACVRAQDSVNLPLD